MAPDAFARTFTPKELVRRAAAVGGRRPGEALPAFLDRVHEGRTPQQLMGNDAADDVADPIGGPRSGYERTAVELEQLALSIAALLAPGAARRRRRPAAPRRATRPPPSAPLQET